MTTATTDEEPFYLNWEVDVRGHKDFIARLDQAASPGTPIALIINARCLAKFQKLPDKAAFEVLEAVKACNINHVWFFDALLPVEPPNPPSHRTFRRAYVRFRQLCETFGSMASVKKLQIVTGENPFTTAHGFLMRSLPQITTFDLYCRDEDVAMPLNLGELVSNGLLGHPSVENIELSWISPFYHGLLPVVRSLPSLNRVRLYDGVKVERDNVQAIADLILINSPLTVVLEHLNLSGEGIESILCHGIADAGISDLVLLCCKLSRPVLLANALTRSSLKAFRIDDSFTDEAWPIFTTSLSSQILSMSRLEKLSLGNQFVATSTAFDEGLETLVHAAARSPSLKCFA
jgi:hypothetical protein